MVPAPFIVVVDANVLFPLTLRDTVLRAAAADFYQLRSSNEILDDVERNLVATGTMPAGRQGREPAWADGEVRLSIRFSGWRNRAGCGVPLYANVA
jgi:hypothetical protein